MTTAQDELNNLLRLDAALSVSCLECTIRRGRRAANREGHPVARVALGRLQYCRTWLSAVRGIILTSAKSRIGTTIFLPRFSTRMHRVLGLNLQSRKTGKHSRWPKNIGQIKSSKQPRARTVSENEQIDDRLIRAIARAETRERVIRLLDLLQAFVRNGPPCPIRSASCVRTEQVVKNHLEADKGRALPRQQG